MQWSCWGGRRLTTCTVAGPVSYASRGRRCSIEAAGVPEHPSSGTPRRAYGPARALRRLQGIESVCRRYFRVLSRLCAAPGPLNTWPKIPSVLVDRPRSLSASRPCMVHADFTLKFQHVTGTGTDPSNQKSLWKTSASDRDVREPSFWPRRGPCRDHRGARGRACARRNGLRAATNAHVRPSFRKAASIRLMRPHRVMMPSVSRKGRPTRASRARARRRATDRRLRTASRPRRG